MLDGHLFFFFCVVFFFEAEDGIRDLVRSRGLGDVYKRQLYRCRREGRQAQPQSRVGNERDKPARCALVHDRPLLGAPLRDTPCLLYTSDAADERSSVDLGGRRIIKKKKKDIKKKKQDSIYKKTN